MPTPPLIPQAVTAPTAAQHAALLAMLVAWGLAVVVAVWGALREARRADADRRRELATERTPGPTPGLEGFLDRWALWSLVLLGVGLLLLAYAANIVRA